MTTRRLLPAVLVGVALLSLGCAQTHEARQKAEGRARRAALRAKRAFEVDHTIHRERVALAREACRNGDQAKCRLLAFSLMYGDGVPPDRKEAFRVLLATCQNRDGLACFALGRRWEWSKKAPALARAYFKEGCIAGHAQSCRQLAELLRLGLHGEADVEGARQALARSCALASDANCPPLTSLSPKRVTPEPGLPKPLVGTRIRSSLPFIRGCYLGQLEVTPTLAGKVHIRFGITPTGKTFHVRVHEDTTGSPHLSSCVVEVISQLRFPENERGEETYVSYPFFFFLPTDDRS